MTAAGLVLAKFVLEEFFDRRHCVSGIPAMRGDFHSRTRPDSESNQFDGAARVHGLATKVNAYDGEEVNRGTRDDRGSPDMDALTVSDFNDCLGRIHLFKLFPEGESIK
jgi:hypothetical protein